MKEENKEYPDWWLEIKSARKKQQIALALLHAADAMLSCLATNIFWNHPEITREELRDFYEKDGEVYYYQDSGFRAFELVRSAQDQMNKGECISREKLAKLDAALSARIDLAENQNAKIWEEFENSTAEIFREMRDLAQDE